MNQQQGQGQQNQQAQTGQQQQNQKQGQGSGMYNQNDAYLCNDLLSTEKYVSSSYDTAIFEFRDANIRNVLNHIQRSSSMGKPSLTICKAITCTIHNRNFF